MDTKEVISLFPSADEEIPCSPVKGYILWRGGVGIETAVRY